MNPPSDYLRLRTRPRPETPPQGCVDLSFDSATGSFVKRDSSGVAEAIGGGATAATVQAALTADPDGALAALGSTVNHQNFTAKKVSAWNNSASPPVRILNFGDSFSTGLFIGPRMGIAGWIGLTRVTGSGTITDLTGRYDLWLSGNAVELAVGATSQFTEGGSATGDIRGDKACIAYIKRSGGGSFVLQYASNGNGNADPTNDTGWTTLATIDTANATTIGAYNEYSLPTSNAPFYRLRIKTVTTGSVIIIAPGIYNSTGGGVIWMPVASQQGTEFSDMVTTPSAILTPIWTGLAPDLVLSCSLDEAEEFESGGNFRTLYNTLIGIKADTDWIQIGQHNVDMGDPSNSTADVPAANLAMRNWALEANQTFFDPSPFVGSFEDADAAGLMDDNKHLNVAGRQVRNNALWATLPIGSMDLGAVASYGPDGTIAPIMRYATIAGNITTQPVEMARPLTMRGSTAGVRFFSRNALMNNGASWEVYNTGANNELNFIFGGSLGVIFGTSTDTGIHPSFDDAKCGRTSFRWQIMGTTIRAATYTVATLPAAATRGAGAAAFVSDSNATLAAGHGNTVVGGGANFVPVYSDGTNWKIG